MQKNNFKTLKTHFWNGKFITSTFRNNQLKFFGSYKFITIMESKMGFTLDPDYLKMIENLRRSIDLINSNFDVTEIPKLHIILTHVPQFLAKTKRALGEFSEQALEATHSLFVDVWKKYQMKDISAANYNTRYYRAIMDFNANNI